MKTMYIIITMLITSLFWACDKRDPIIPAPPIVEQDTIFELIWSTRLDFEKGIVGCDMQYVYGGNFINFGDLDYSATIFGYNIDTGDKDWTYTYEGWDNTNIDACYGIENVLVCVTGKRVFGYDISTNAVLWEKDFFNIGLRRGAGILARNGKFYQSAVFNFNPLGGGVQHLYEFEPITGDMRQIYSRAPDSIGTKTISPPVIWEDDEKDRTLFIVNERPNAATPPEETIQDIVAIDLETKEVVWKTNVNDGFASNSLHPPIIYEDLVITGGDWSIYAFDVQTGEQLWRYEIPGHDMFSIWTKTNHLIYDGRLYVNENGENVTCLNPETGELIWNNPKGGPNCTDNMLYYEKEDLLVFTSWGYGSVMILDALTGETLHREHRYDNSSYNNDIVYDEDRDMFFTSTYKHAIGFKVHRPK